MAADYHIELFIFPDGMAVEMMVFASVAGADTALARFAEAQLVRQVATSAREPALIAAGDADRCPLCGSDLIYPVDWERTSPTTWRVTLRCPDCDLIRHARLDREGIERLNRAAYSGNQTILREAEELARQFFEEEGEKLVSALRRDLILPMDF